MRTYDEIKASMPFDKFVDALGKATQFALDHPHPVSEEALRGLLDDDPIALELFGLSMLGMIAAEPGAPDLRAAG